MNIICHCTKVHIKREIREKDLETWQRAEEKEWKVVSYHSWVVARLAAKSVLEEYNFWPYSLKKKENLIIMTMIRFYASYLMRRSFANMSCLVDFTAPGFLSFIKFQWSVKRFGDKSSFLDITLWHKKADFILVQITFNLFHSLQGEFHVSCMRINFVTKPVPHRGHQGSPECILLQYNQLGHQDPSI